MTEFTDKNTQTEKTFTRDETEAIVEARLARERRNNEALIPIRELIHRLRKVEPYRSLSTAELSELILQKLGQAVKDTASVPPLRADGETEKTDSFPETGKTEFTPEPTTEEVPPESVITAPLPSEKVPPEDFPTEKPLVENTSVETVSDEKIPLKTVPNTAETLSETEREEAAQKRRREDIRRFLAAYGEETLLSALRDDTFKSFCVGKNGDLCTLYRGYLDFLSALSESKNARLCRAAERQLASTGFSNIASGAPDYGALLTENQKSIAKAAGMSYRDYAEFLEQIPKKRL